MGNVRNIAVAGEDVLNQRAREVKDPQDSAIRTLIDDMMVTMEYAGGIGIAAPQVHESVRLIIVASTATETYPEGPEMEPTVMINPEILSTSGEIVGNWEGCLSIPGVRGIVPRDRRVRARYMTPEGKLVEEELVDLAARVFQHELDHLDGILFPQRASRVEQIGSTD